MTLEDLKVYVDVCAAGNLSEVARRLGRTQPAVSQHIARLERELEVKLFERTPHGVEPTPAGEALRDSAQETLSALASGIGRVEELRGEARRTLTITTGGTSVRHFLRQTVVEFRRRRPAVELRFLPENTTARCLDRVKSGEADLAMVTVHGSHRGVEQRVLAHQDLRLLVSEDHRLAKRKRLRLSELDGLAYIGLSDETTSAGYLGHALSEQGVALQQVMTVDDFDTACVFVELGLGASIVPAVQAANFTRTLRVKSVPVRDLPAISIGLAARRWASLPDVAHEFTALFARDLRRLARLPGVVAERV